MALLSIITLSINRVHATLAQAIKDVLQYNVAGIPLTHEEVKIEFDPEVSKKRRELYYEVIFLCKLNLKKN